MHSHPDMLRECAESSCVPHTVPPSNPYITSLEAENTTLAKQVDALHRWFTARPDSDAYDARLAQWYARGQRLFYSTPDDAHS